MWVRNCGSTENTSRARYKPCKCGHNDTQLALERLNAKTIPVGKAEGSTESTGQKRLQRRQWARNKRKGIRNRDDGETVQEENQTENKRKNQEWENENPVRADRESTSAAGFWTHQGQRRRKPVTGNARDSQNTALPFCAWLGCALGRFRIHFSRMAMDAAGKQTKAVFSLHWKWPAAFVFSH